MPTWGLSDLHGSGDRQGLVGRESGLADVESGGGDCGNS